MKLPLQVVFLGMQPSPAVQAQAVRRAQALDRYAGNLMACRVEVAQLQKHRHQGQPFGVRIQLTLPGHHLSVDHVQHEDVYVALRDAFADIRRQLQDVVRRDRGQVKLHAEPAAPQEPTAAAPSLQP